MADIIGLGVNEMLEQKKLCRHLNGDGGLVVAVGGEGLGLLGGNGGVALDE